MRRRALLLLLVVPLLVRCVVHDDDERTCWSDEECGAAAYCEGAAISECGGRTGTCRARLGEGEECSPWDDSCRAGLTCHNAYDPPECRPPSPLGGACRWDLDCDDDLDRLANPDDPVCVGADPAGAPGACAAAGSVPTGGACETWRACAAPDSCSDGVCRGPGAEGQTCATSVGSDDRPPCAEGLYCDGRRGAVCVRALAEGERCSSDGERCAEGLFCYSQEAVCHAPLGEGAACLPLDVCADGLFCSSRAICRAPLAEGEACWGADRCVEGLFCYSREAVCHVPLADGEPCEPLVDVCSEGLFCERTAELCRPQE